MDQTRVIILGVFIVAIIGLLIYGLTRNVDEIPEVTPSPTPEVTPTPDSDNDVEANISVSTPSQDQQVGLPLVVEGEARVFESTLQARLRDADGTILVERHTMTDAPDAGQFGPYRIELYYPQPSGQTGTVEVFQYSARDGSEIDMVTIPVQFQAVQGINVQVYYSSTEEDPNTERCEVTHAVQRRIPQTDAVARASLEQLLLGPSNNEADDGFHTSIPMNVQIRSITIQEGTARADFSSELNQVSGSCAVQAARSQIENTLLQFPTVNNVEILVEGSSEEVLEP